MSGRDQKPEDLILPPEETARRARIVAERIRAGNLEPFVFPPYVPAQRRLPEVA